MIIEQILHGYDHGHTKIASSILLPSAKDLLMMDNMSDWSGYNSTDGYLTIYKLEESQYFVIAKTWYASEMERAGSVWTHSLLVKIDKIPRNFDFRFLLNYFTRPQKGNYIKYQSSINAENFTLGEDELLSEEIMPQMLLLYDLLQEGNKSITFSIDLPQKTLQLVLVTILQYLPLDIVWNISGCTGTLTPRKYGSGFLSIQFVESSSNKLFSGKINENYFTPDVLEILEYLRKCMRNVNDDFFSAFRIFTNDIGTSSGRAKTIIYSLMKLDQAIRETHGKSDDYISILDHISSKFQNKEDGIKIKESFLGDKILSLFYANKINWLHDILSLALINAFDTQLIYRELLAVYDNDRESVWNLVQSLVADVHLSSISKQIVNQFVYSRTEKEVAEWYAICPESFMKFASYDPELLSNKIWLLVSSAINFNQLLFIFIRHIPIKFTAWRDLIKRILNEHCSVPADFAKLMIHEDCSVVSIILDFQNLLESLSIDRELLLAAVSQTEILVKWVKSHPSIHDVISSFIIDDINFNDRKIKLTDDIFWMNVMHGKTMPSSRDYSYFYVVAHMIDRGEHTLDIIKPTFYYLHLKLSQNKDVELILSTVEPYLYKVIFWKDWDNCLKLRKGLVIWLKNSHYPRCVLKKFTSDSKINKELIKLWGKK